MDQKNQTIVREFYFSNVHRFENNSLLFFIPLLFIYVFIIVENFMIFFVVLLDTDFYNPMCNFISIFSFLEIWYTTVTIPKMLSPLVSEQKIISFIGYLLEKYFFHLLGVTETLVLIVTLTGMLPSATTSAVHSFWLDSTCSSSLDFASSASLYSCQRLCGLLPFCTVSPTTHINSSVTLNLCCAWPVHGHDSCWRCDPYYFHLHFCFCHHIFPFKNHHCNLEDSLWLKLSKGALHLCGPHYHFLAVFWQCDTHIPGFLCLILTATGQGHYTEVFCPCPIFLPDNLQSVEQRYERCHQNSNGIKKNKTKKLDLYGTTKDSKLPLTR